MFRAIWNFVKKTAKAVVRFVGRTVVDIVNHAETAVSMVVESIGWTVVLGALPFMVAVPMWLEATMVVPVLAVLMTFTLATVAMMRQDLGLVIGG